MNYPRVYKLLHDSKLAAPRVRLSAEVTVRRDRKQRVIVGHADWYAMISNDGSLSRGIPQGVEQLLELLEEQPLAFAMRYGLETGSCCFCGLTLTDPRSRDVGYGPICAEHYGLPWGDESMEGRLARLRAQQTELERRLSL